MSTEQTFKCWVQCCTCSSIVFEVIFHILVVIAKTEYFIFWFKATYYYININILSAKVYSEVTGLCSYIAITNIFHFISQNYCIWQWVRCWKISINQTFQCVSVEFLNEARECKCIGLYGYNTWRYFFHF